HGDHDRDRRRDDAVVVERAQHPTPEIDRRVCSRSGFGVDHARIPWRTPAATMTSWAAPTPSTTGHAEMPNATATSSARAVNVIRRMTLAATNGAPLPSRAVIANPLAEPTTRPAAT